MRINQLHRFLSEWRKIEGKSFQVQANTFIIVVLLLFVTSALAQDPPRFISPRFFGMHINKLNDPWPSTVGIPFSGYRTHDSGISRWSQMNPSPGVYSWKWFDIGLNNAALYDNPVVHTFYYTPRWASSNPTGSCLGAADGGCFPPNDINPDGSGTDQHVKDFITALMQHVGPGKIRYIEIWNEFNQQGQWAGTIPQLVRITKDVAAIAKAYDPNIAIVSPAETGDWSPICCSLNMKWLASFLAAGGGDYVDVIGLHGHVTQPEDIIQRTNSALAVMAQYGQSGKRLFDTEASWPIYQGLTPALQRGFLFREYLASVSTPTRKLFVYSYDIPNTASFRVSSTSQLTANGRAYQLFYAWLAGSTLTSKCRPVTSTSTTWSCSFVMTDGTQAMAVWDTGVPFPNTVPVTVPSIYTKYLTLDGSSYSIGPNHQVNAGYEPLWLEN